MLRVALFVAAGVGKYPRDTIYGMCEECGGADILRYLRAEARVFTHDMSEQIYWAQEWLEHNH